MHKINIKKAAVEYLSYITLLFALLLVASTIFYKEDTVEEENLSVSSVIEYSDDITKVHVEYPRFKDNKINKIVTDNIYSYVKKFRTNENNKVLDITYDLYYIKDEFVNINFYIENTLDNIKNKNILINLKNKKIDYITSVYDRDYLDNEIKEQVYYKYSSQIYEKIKNETINNFTYIMDDNKIDVYFNNIKFEDIEYIPNISIVFNTNTSINDNDYEGKKYIAFTYDDGPSEYTSEILKTLELNKSSATFFMIGNRMKKFESTILDIESSGSEIGTHTYSHKNLTLISADEVEKEINSSSIIYNKMTGNNYKYIRPPYGKYDGKLNKYNLKVILWNIDPKDWLVKDSDKIYNNVIKNACDGCIVLMHDIYPETVEASKKLIPALNEKGYEVVSVTKLLEIKGYNDEIKEISYIK